MNDREFSNIEILQHSRKGIPLCMTGHKNCLQSDYFLGPGPRLIKKNIYWAAVSQRSRNTALEGQALFINEVSRSHSGTPQSVGPIRTSDQPVAQTST
jgi:hypothetical protein